MTEKEDNVVVEMTAEEEPKKLAKASHQYTILQPQRKTSTPWSARDIDKLTFDDKKWKNVVKECRYYYKRDPFASTVINKMVDLSINNIIVREKTARKSIKLVLEAIKGDLLVFLRNAALEYLLSGLVVPEISFDAYNKTQLHELGIKRFERLVLPSDMWIRDPGTIVVKDPVLGSKKSYLVEIPDAFRTFILNKGVYSDGTKDKELYKQLVQDMPDFVKAVRKGETTLLLDNPLVVQYRTLAGETYPTPYLFSVLESLKHKRNLRRMDYSIAARIITAIMLVRLGNDEYPLTEDNEDQLEALKLEMRWRETQSSREMERIFQLFGNHTLDIEWVFPDVKPLLDDVKYKNINQDIAVGLGFPRILITGETERSFASDPEIATVSPVLTMNRMQDAITPIMRRIVDEIVAENNFGGNPEVMFAPINLMAVSSFVEGLQNLYDTGNLSREDYARIFGFDIFEQLLKREVENKLLEKLDLEEFAPVPHSNEPEVPGTNKSKTKPKKKKKKEGE